MNYEEIENTIHDIQVRAIARQKAITDALYRKLNNLYNNPSNAPSHSDIKKTLRQFVLSNKKIFRSTKRIRLFRLLASLQWITPAKIVNSGKYSPARARRAIASLRKIIDRYNLPLEIIYKRKLGYRLNFKPKNI